MVSTLQKSVVSISLSLSLLMSIISTPIWAFDRLTATVDKNPVMLDESIILTLEANDSLPRDAFDTSVLEKDFKVVRTSVSNQMRSVNLTRSVSTTWTTVLFPRNTGRVSIPAITINSIQSNPIDVLVVPVSQASSQTRNVFISATVNPDIAYVQQQLTYQVKLFLAVELERGSLQVPNIDNAIMEQMGEDKESSAIQNGKRYRVIERNYSLIPQESGQLVIPSPVFEGSIRTRNRGSFGGLFNPSKPVNQIGPEVVLDIKPIPNNYDEPWLPSEFVQIDEAWSADVNALTVGEPITRTITLSAIGVDDSVLPQIDSRLPPSIKAYPDQPQLTTVDKDNTLIAQKVINTALVPGRAGDFVLPAITIPWFNTLTGTTEYAEIRAQRISVQAAVGNTNTVAPKATPITNPSNALPISNEHPGAWYQQALPWQIATFLVLVLWGCSIWFASKTPPLLTAQNNKDHAIHRSQHGAKQHISQRSILRSIDNNAFKYMQQDLLQWMSQQYPYQPTLHAYAQATGDTTLQEAITDMYAWIYNQQGDEQLIRANLRQAVTNLAMASEQDQGLAPLYPNT